MTCAVFVLGKYLSLLLYYYYYISLGMFDYKLYLLYYSNTNTSRFGLFSDTIVILYLIFTLYDESN